jgi:hypothetical protein
MQWINDNGESRKETKQAKTKQQENKVRIQNN